MKKFFVFILTAVMLFSLAACGEGDETVIEATLGEEGERVVEVVPDEAPEEVPKEPHEEAPEAETAMVSAVYYHGDDTAEHIVEEAAELPERYEPQDVIDLLIEKGVLAEGIKVNSYNVDSSGLMEIDFSKEFAENLQGMGTAGETIIIGSTVNTLITNFNLKSVLMTVDGESVETGHNIYKYALEFYTEKNPAGIQVKKLSVSLIRYAQFFYASGT